MDTSRISWRVIALFTVLILATTACGTNDGAGSSPAAPDASGAPAASAGASAATDLSGELTVWAMGNEGTKLGVMADKFMEANPGVTVNVTPVDWGQAVAKLQTAIGGGETPDVSQMGTDMMGQFVETGALEPVGAGIDPSSLFRERVADRRRRRPGLRRPVVCRDARALLPDRHRGEGRDHGSPRDLGRPQGDGPGDAVQGRRRKRHRARDQEWPGVPAVRLVERRRCPR